MSSLGHLVPCKVRTTVCEYPPQPKQSTLTKNDRNPQPLLDQPDMIVLNTGHKPSLQTSNERVRAKPLKFIGIINSNTDNIMMPPPNQHTNWPIHLPQSISTHGQTTMIRKSNNSLSRRLNVSNYGMQK